LHASAVSIYLRFLLLLLLLLLAWKQKWLKAF
jgi:hypothetical protein